MPAPKAPPGAEPAPHPAVASGAVVPLLGRPHYAHAGTGNASFLKMSADLARQGVRNHRFMLSIYDPDLHGVDPHDPGLDDHAKAKILTEITQNPWYFLREVVRIPVPGGLTRFEIHPGNLFLLWCMMANINVFLILPRQTYKTFSAVSFYLWVYCFGATNSHILFFNKEHGDSKNNLKRLKDVLHELPAWLKGPVLTNQQRDVNQIESIVSANRGNKIDAKPAGKDQNHADKLGRGATVPVSWYDELAFMKYAKTTYNAAAPAGSKAKELAALNGSPYGTCITTTPNNLDLPEAEFSYMIMTGALQFRPEFYDLGPARVKQMIEAESDLPFVAAQFTWREIGKTEAWYRSQCRELLNDRTVIKRELDLVWPLSGEGAVFEEQQLDDLRNHLLPYAFSLPVRPARGDVPPGLSVQWIEAPDVMLNYVVGIDSAAGEGTGDYTAFTFHHPADMRAVGCMKTRTTDTEAIRTVAEHVLCGLFPNSVVVCERNYLGLALINFMIRELKIEHRLFYVTKVKEAQRTVGRGSGKSLALKQKVREYGVHTDSASREAMIRQMFNIVDELPHLWRISDIQNELRTLQRKKNGKVEHRSGFHDDVLFSSLICHFADRSDGGVLRVLLSQTAGSGSRMEAARPLIAMNLRAPAEGREPPVPPAQPGLPPEVPTADRTVSTHDYVRRVDERLASEDPRDRRRREMSALIVGLNSPSGR